MRYTVNLLIIRFGVYEDGSTPEPIETSAADLVIRPGPDKLLGKKALEVSRGVKRGVIDNPNDLRQAGWGVIYGSSVNQEIKNKLRVLLKHREEKDVQDERGVLFQKFDGERSPRPATADLPEESVTGWLARVSEGKVSPGDVDPADGVPYYLLIVASPEEITFDFQTELDLYWAVGRIWFSTPAEFEQYAQSVVECETCDRDEIPTAKQMVFFAAENVNDDATPLLMKQLVTPLMNGEGPKPTPVCAKYDFPMRKYLGSGATKKNLTEVLCGAIPNGTPALLFTGTHGHTPWPPDDPRNRTPDPTDPGALLCQEWVKHQKTPLTPEQCFGAIDLDDKARVKGMIHFMFACFGVGIPMMDSYIAPGGTRGRLATHSMISPLPQRMLSHPNGGALAVFGHVDIAYADSFQPRDGEPQTVNFRRVIQTLMDHNRIGHASDHFNSTWAILHDRWKRANAQKSIPPTHEEANEIAALWKSTQDARAFVVFGDPAVKLREDMKTLANQESVQIGESAQ